MIYNSMMIKIVNDRLIALSQSMDTNDLCIH